MRIFFFVKESNNILETSRMSESEKKSVYDILIEKIQNDQFLPFKATIHILGTMRRSRVIK